MRHFTILIAAGAAVLLAGTANAGKKPEDPNKLICKFEENSGSRITRTKTCHTRAEWTQVQEERRRDAEQGMDSTYRQGVQPVADRPN
jgi:hypothetical protein